MEEFHLITEQWRIEYDEKTDQYSIDFGEKFSIHWTEKKTVETFIRWRLDKIKNNDIVHS
jgi:hypothetical protein